VRTDPAVDRRFDVILAGGLLVFVGGSARDVVWHATHNAQKDFETAATQIEVHWLLWVGALLLLGLSALALRRPDVAGSSRAYAIIFASGAVYVPVSIWHFIEHANGTDPQIAHLFLYLAAMGLVVGAVLALANTVKEGRLRGRPDGITASPP
jgi:hypothetical protein